MSIIKCKDCGKEVSKNAASCPGCGAPIKEKKTGCLSYGCLGIILFFIVSALAPSISSHGNAVDKNEVAAPANPANIQQVKPVKPPEIKIVPFWEKRNFVDQFGTNTKEEYITNGKKIIGKFSNSATQGSPLGVDFIITNDTLAIQLYEYNRGVPLKWPSDRKYLLSIDCNEVKDLNLLGVLHRDRITFENESMTKVLTSIKSNKEVKFYIKCEDRSTDEYYFAIPSNSNY